MKLIGSIFLRYFVKEHTDRQSHRQTQSKKPRHANHGQGLIIFSYDSNNKFNFSIWIKQFQFLLCSGCCIYFSTGTCSICLNCCRPFKWPSKIAGGGQLHVATFAQIGNVCVIFVKEHCITLVLQTSVG